MTTRAGNLRALGDALLECAERSLLDRPLDELAASLDNAAVRDLFADAHATGEVDCLRDLLEGGELAALLERTATASEERALIDQLSAWLGLTAAGPDDPARLGRVSPVPRELEALLRWARPYGLIEALVQPARELLPAVDGIPAPECSLVECCLGQFDLEPGADEQIERARTWLHVRASEQAALRARELLWQSTLPDGPVSLLRSRLAGLIGLPGRVSSTELSSLAAPRFVPAWPAALDAATGVCRARLRDLAAEPFATQLLLSGYEQRALEAECTCGRSRCLHVRALAARLIDACHDPSDRLHAPLIAFTQQPSWRRFLSALQPEPPRGPTAALERVAFHVQLVGARARVGAVVQKRLGDGRFSPGKLATPRVLLRTGVCAEHDRPVLEAMDALVRTLGATRVTADATLLRALSDHPHTFLDEPEALPRPVALREQNVSLDLQQQPEGLLPKLTLAGAPVGRDSAPRDAAYVLHWDAAHGQLWFAPLTAALRKLIGALEHFRGVLPPESYASLAPWLASIRSVAQIELPEVLRNRERPAPKKLLLRIAPRLEEGVDLWLSLRGLPLGALWSPGQGPELVYGLEDGVGVSVRRDLEWERVTGASVLDTLGLTGRAQTADGAVSVYTTQEALDVLSRAAYLHDVLEIEWAELARQLKINARVAASDLHVRLFQKGDWVTLEGGVEHPDAVIAIDRLLDAVKRGERYVRVDGESYAEIEQDLFARLERAQLVVHTSSATPEREPALSAAAVPFWLAQLGERSSAPEDSTARWIERLQNPPDVNAALDPVWHARLRAYQRAGVKWLLSRSQWAPGACLADEMGLGKTVQTIAFLSARAQLGPALVIAPTSVVANWQAELQRFAPELRVLLYRGAHRRARLVDLGPGAIMLASYETVLRDRAQLAEHVFATQVVDEAQTIRNARTLRARAVAGIAADFRLALSGTPVENRLGDLWSLFQLIAPGLLGGWSRFRALFAVPIERHERPERAAELRALIAPFILRRTKREVLPELPPRTEVIHMIEPSPAEQALYDGALRQVRRALKRRSSDSEVPQLQMLAELTRLRQLACHPRLVLQDERAESSKLASLMQLLGDILPRGHRVLVFSQFTRHLALVREALDAAGIRYLYLDGATPAAQRGELVERFQTGEEPAFLISLKAGGTGLNLTQADYVVHMDPWWNPAAEDQASDRAHRFGQTRPLTVVKLVARGTIEEKVLGLHGHKRRLAEAVFGGSATGGALDRATLEALLSG